MTSTVTTRNGIDVAQLTDTVQAVEQDSSAAAFTFKAKSTWEDGTHNIGKITDFVHAGRTDGSRSASFVLHGDEPPVLLGNNEGPNAVELILQALAFCYAVGYAANAAARGIEIESMEYEVEGDLDVRAFLGLEGPRPGFTRIRAVGRVSSPNATTEQLAELCQYVQQTSPVLDCLTNAVPVETSLEVV